MILTLLWLLILLAVIVALGRTLLGLLIRQWRSPLEQTLFAAAVGMGVFAHATLALGLAGLLYWWAGVGLLGVSALLSLKELRGLTEACARRITNLRLRSFRLSPVQVTLVGLMAVHGFLTFVGALAPPTFGDALGYHLSAPEIYLREHRIFFAPNWLYNFPTTEENLYLLAMLLCNDRVAVMFNWGVGLLLVLTIFTFTRRYFSSGSGLLASAIYFCAPLVAVHSTSAKNNLGLAFFLLLAFYATVGWLETRSNRWLFLAGICAGLAASTKLVGFFAVGALASVIAYKSATELVQFRLRKTLACVFSFLFISALVAAPPLVKNWWFTGDPLWPILYPILGGSYMDVYHHSKVMAHSHKAGLGRDWFHFLITPFQLFWFQNRFDVPEKWPLQIQFLAFLPGLWLVRRSISPRAKSIIVMIFLFCLLFYVQWFLTYHNANYFTALFPLLAVVLGGVVSRLAGCADAMVRTTTIACLFLTFTFYTLFVIVYCAQFFPVVLGTQSEDEYLSAKVCLYEDMAYASRNLPAGSRVAIFFQQDYYLKNRIGIGPNYATAWIDYRSLRTPGEFLRQLHSIGITHIFLTSEDLRGLIPGPAADNARFTGIFESLRQQGYLVPVYSNPAAKLVESRTLGQINFTTVTLLEVRYDRDRGPKEGHTGDQRGKNGS